MQLAADSNSDVARKEAILNLIGSTSNSAESEKVVQLKRTLTFLRTKLKNEKIEMRIHGLTVLIEKVHPPLNLFFVFPLFLPI